MSLRLSRPPVNKEELWHLVYALWGVKIPRQRVCPHHTAPFDAFAEAFFGNRNNWVLWYGSRGTGKSYMLAILALTKAAAMDINVTLLGGSMAQSQNVYEHVDELMRAENAPLYAIERQIKTEITFMEGNWIRPLPASQKTVRGPHPHMTLLDEIDEMEKAIYDAAMGQALEKPNARGFIIPEMVVASSTWQNPVGTFQMVIDDARMKGLPIRTWCFREVLQTEENPYGWMKPDFIERKRNTVPAEMFRIEYELGEPSGTARAFDLAALERCLTDAQPTKEYVKENDALQVYEEPVPHGFYATGADWAKENDSTVISTYRIDVEPARLVYVQIMNRRPWPEMIDTFNQTVKRYQGVSSHDATGIGNVVGDLIDERTVKFVMVGRNRTMMLSEYIAAVERGVYAIPRAAERFVQAHKATTVSSVFSTVTMDSKKHHLPDEVASAALAHHAALRGGWVGFAEGVKKSNPDETAIPDWLAELETEKQRTRMESFEGVVVQVEEKDDIGVFWLS